jgi:hypothetical protein
MAAASTGVSRCIQFAALSLLLLHLLLLKNHNIGYATTLAAVCLILDETVSAVCMSDQAVPALNDAVRCTMLLRLLSPSRSATSGGRCFHFSAFSTMLRDAVELLPYCCQSCTAAVLLLLPS